MAGEHCGRWCGWCGRCDASYGALDPLPRVEDLPEPIPDLYQRLAAAKAERDERFKRAVTREFSKPSAA